MLWLSHDRGLSKFNSTTLRVENFDLSDGLQGMEFNFASAFRDTAGKIYFGGNNGYNVIDPSTESTNDYIPPLIITEIRINNEEIPYHGQEKITLDYNVRKVTFRFSSLDYTNPLANLYRYKLEGLDTDWNESSSTSRIAPYM